MEKIVRVGEYEFSVRSSAATLLSYRKHFGRDGMKDLLVLVKSFSNKNTKSEDDADLIVQTLADGSFEIETLYRFIWTFAKSADKTLLPMEEWLDNFDVPALEFISEVFPQVSELLFSMAKTNVVPRKK